MYEELIDKNRIPEHVAIIMDGNGRWATQQGKERTEGHIQGVQVVRQLTQDAVRLGIKYLTLYTFSTENWNRPIEEINALMLLLFKNLEEELFVKNDVRFCVIGDISRIPEEVRAKLNELIERTSNFKRSTLILALSYSSRWEITDTAKKLARQVAEGKISPEEITEDMFSANLNTNFMPDPDLLIRTGGEVRLSNYLLWQAAYSELYFCDTFWPDFNKEELCKAILSYQERERRFGKTSAQIAEESKEK